MRGGEPAPSDAEVLGALTGSRPEGVVLGGKTLPDAAGDGWMTYSAFILISCSGK